MKFTKYKKQIKQSNIYVYLMKQDFSLDERLVLEQTFFSRDILLTPWDSLLS